MLSPNLQPLLSKKCARLILISLADITATHQHPSHTFALLFRWWSRVSCGAHGVTCSSWSGKKRKPHDFVGIQPLQIKTWWEVVMVNHAKSFFSSIVLMNKYELNACYSIIGHQWTFWLTLFWMPLKPHPIHALCHPHPPKNALFADVN